MDTQKDNLSIENGKLLLAEPFMGDPNFKRAVVLLCDHHEDGTLGFILNKPINMNINSLLDSFPDFDVSVYYGGPVQTDTIHYLHTHGDLLDGSIEVLPGVYWGGDFEALKFLVKTELIQPNDIRFFIGYAGWTKGQLAEEVAHQSWFLAEGDSNFVFKAKADETLWTKVLEQQGAPYSIIAHMPMPNWN